MKISTGVDIVEIDRIKKLADKYPDNHALRHIFCEKEILFCNAKGKSKYQSFAARFAAKEALAKALGTGIGKNCDFKEICIQSKESGEPLIILSGKTKETFEEQNGMDISLSLSHSREYAIAMVVIMKGDKDE